MPKYHFEIVDGYTIEDPVGMDCKSQAQAIEVAKNIARQIEKDVKDSGARKVSVKTDDGTEIHKVPVKS
jgi:uncharacterized protein DUF6894